MEPRVAALEEGMKEIKAALKEIQAGQQAAALAAAQAAGDSKAALADVNGKLTNLHTLSDGLRRDLDRLPTKFDVATILVLVIGGLAGAATLVKTVLPLLLPAR